MAAVARLESTLAFNDVQFTQGIERAEKRAQTFAGRVETSFQGLFRKTPGRRAERALSGLLGDISTGSLSQGITSFASRLTGLGLVAGVGVGVAVEIFDKLHDHIKTVDADTEALRQEMAKPFNIIAGLSPEAIEQQAGLLKAKYDKIVEDHKGFAQTFTNVFRDAWDATADFGTSGNRDTRQEQDALDKLHKIQSERGAKELEMARARAATGGDEMKSALTEQYFKRQAAESAIQLEGGGKGDADRLKALELNEKRITDEIVHRSEVREQEFATAEKLLKLERSGISEPEKKKMGAALGLESINQQLKSPDLSTGERRALTLEKLRKQNEIRSMGAGQNPFAWGTSANREWEDQNAPGFGSISKRTAETNDPSVYGSLAASRASVGMMPQAKQEPADVVKAIQEATAAFVKAISGEGG